jgi:chloride channel 3/4/5
MPGASHTDHTASASSSSHSPIANTPPSTSDDRDEIDFLGDDTHDTDIGDQRHDRDLLDDDPIRGDLRTPLSFKRRGAKPSRLQIFLSGLTGAGGAGSSQQQQQQTYDYDPTDDDGDGDDRTAPIFTGVEGSNLNTAAGKGAAPLDWYMEGPGRRVGYDNLTAIDWIFEYSKERQRLRVLSSGASGLAGYLRHLLDASQVWVVLLLTGVLVGTVAACINITSDWLGDLKEGFCASGPDGGQFYLSKSFCCYGYDEGSKCMGWKTWPEAMGIEARSGKWIIGYIFFLLFSVRALLRIAALCCINLVGVLANVNS